MNVNDIVYVILGGKTYNFLARITKMFPDGNAIVTSYDNYYGNCHPNSYVVKTSKLRKIN